MSGTDTDSWWNLTTDGVQEKTSYELMVHVLGMHTEMSLGLTALHG